jgi:hypothetical protein
MAKTLSEQIENLKESLETTTGELEDARLELKEPPEWGNCRRGCPASYLDRDGFCSPACVVGAPRGQYVTAVA